jgi:hypothetical protein
MQHCQLPYADGKSWTADATTTRTWAQADKLDTMAMSFQLFVLLVAAYFMSNKQVDHKTNPLSVGLALLSVAVSLAPVVASVVLAVRSRRAQHFGEGVDVTDDGKARFANPLHDEEQDVVEKGEKGADTSKKASSKKGKKGMDLE